MTTRATEAQLEQASELAWLLLAVDKFGSVGSKTQAGATLIKAGLARKTGDDVFALTPLGQKWVRRIHLARR